MRETRSWSGALLAVLAAIALLLSSCSDAKPDEEAKPSSEQPAITGEPAGFNADDLAFATGMVTYHRQAIDMSALAPGRSADDELMTLASDIGAAQGPQLELMKVFVVQWNENPDTNVDQGGQVNATGAGVVDDATLARLESLSGPEFDALWLQSMMANHQGAIELTEAELARGANVDALPAAKRSLDALLAELGRIQQLLG